MRRRSFLALGLVSGLSLATTMAAPAEQPSEPFTVDGRVALGAYRALVEEHVTGVLSALKALAQTTDAQTGDWVKIKPALTTLAGNLPTAATVWFAQPDGSYSATSGDTADQTLKDRDYFPRLLAGDDVVGSLVVSKSTGHRSIIVATPVKRDGQVVAMLGVSLRARLVSNLVDRKTGLPQGMVFYALDPKGRIAIHQDPDQMFKYPSDMGDETLKSTVSAILSKAEGDVEYDYQGKHMSALFDTSALTGWHFVLVLERK